MLNQQPVYEDRPVLFHDGTSGLRDQGFAVELVPRLSRSNLSSFCVARSCRRSSLTSAEPPSPPGLLALLVLAGLSCTEDVPPILSFQRAISLADSVRSFSKATEDSCSSRLRLSTWARSFAFALDKSVLTAFVCSALEFNALKLAVELFVAPP